MSDRQFIPDDPDDEDAHPKHIIRIGQRGICPACKERSSCDSHTANKWGEIWICVFCGEKSLIEIAEYDPGSLGQPPIESPAANPGDGDVVGPQQTIETPVDTTSTGGTLIATGGAVIVNGSSGVDVSTLSNSLQGNSFYALTTATGCKL